jgi:hypothetical protein
MDVDKPSLVVTHKPQIIDPTTGQPAVLKMTSTRLSIEYLLLDVIRLNVYSKLQKVYKVLTEDSSISPGDIQMSILNDGNHLIMLLIFNDSSSDFSKNYLKICLVQDYCFLFVNVDLRSGSLILKVEPFSANEGKILSVSTHLTDYSDYLKPLEERVNKDNREIKSVVNILRHQKILEHYERISYTMNLEPYTKLPIKPGSMQILLNIVLTII